MKKSMYFVAGSLKDFDYEESFFQMFNEMVKERGASGSLLVENPEELRVKELAAGMDPWFFDATARIFRVTVEEVPREETRQ